jgi:hypothetical protein
MKVNTLGKIFFGALAANMVVRVASKYMDNGSDGSFPDGNGENFTETEVRAMAEAVQIGNRGAFKEIFLFRRPDSSASEIADAYDLFIRRLAE